MRKGIIITVGLIAGIVMADSALAGRVGNRQTRQQERIAQGVQSGEISKREFVSIQREQRHIQRAKKHALSDGKLTPAERIRLERKQNRASHHIYRAKHN